MPTDTTVTDVARNFAEYINRVAYRGESFRLMRGGRAVADLSPVPVGRRLGDLPALLAGLPGLGGEASAFARAVRSARAEGEPDGGGR